MDKPEFILGYWNARGLGEPIRTLMWHLGLHYKEVLYSRKDGPDFDPVEWTSNKYTLGLDFPNIPYLIDGSFKLTECFAIMRYLCRKFEPKLLGANLEEQTTINMLEGFLYDFYNDKKILMFTKDLAQVPPEIKPSLESAVQTLAKQLETKKYLAGDNLSYVDFYCVEVLEAINDLLDPIFEKYPALKRYFEAVMSLPNIKKYRNSDEFLKNPKPYNSKIARIGTTPLKK
eukprot:TRINITY_DN6068_c0_g4_i1.p1 TRINITY_DN6068_c0_g4~~TRINITY_DN6068_c0_g4_i1.p1  ORF type:complete len:251 (-),score=40.02 TRINITY_DN6068_c0_g4_i1:189-878(-)